MRWELYLQAKLRCGLYHAGSVAGPRSCHQQQTRHSHPMKSPLESPDLLQAEPWARPHSLRVLGREQ